MINPDSEYYLSDEAFARKNHLSMDLRGLGRTLQKEGRITGWSGFSLTEDIALFLEVDKTKVINIQADASNFSGDNFPVKVREMDGTRLGEIQKLPREQRPTPGHEEDAVTRVILDREASIDDLVELLRKEVPIPGMN